MTARDCLHALFRPRVLLPLLLAGALLYVAISLGDIGKVIHRILAMPLADLLLALAAAVAYLLLKGAQLRLLLAALDVHPKRRRFLLAFSAGELANTLPLGIFVQNWMLTEQDRDIRFGRSSAATVLMLLTETAVVLALLAVRGIPGWPPLRPLADAALVVLAVLSFAVLRFEPLAQRLLGRLRRPQLRDAMREVIGLIRGLNRLKGFRLFALNFLVSAAYLAALASAFMVVGHGVGLARLDWLRAATIYAFALASILLCGGMFGQVGTVEVIGMSAARASGFGYTDGLALMLGFRVIWTGAMWLLNGPVAWWCWRSARRTHELSRLR